MKSCLAKTRMRAVNKQERRRWFFDAQEGKCCHCGGQMMLEDSRDPRFATFEHLTPRDGKRPKGHNAYNTLMAHKACNEKRAQKPVSEAMFQRARALWTAYFEWRAVPDRARPYQDGERAA